MSNIKNIIGKTFGKLTVTEFVNTNKHNKAVWLCQCSCGRTTQVVAARLSSGHTKSCGCLRGYTNYREYYNSPMYFLYRNMKSRCYNENDVGFKNYGARGIIVCGEWLNNPKSFFDWCSENGWSKELQIDRRNNDGDYTPKNCRFVNRFINAQNRRTLRSNNSSGYTGVFYRKDRSKYVSRIKHNGKTYYIKTCNTAFDAAVARDVFIVENKMDRQLNLPVSV